MSVVIIGADKLQAKLKKIDKSLLTRKIMGKVALGITTFMRERTLSGKDEDGKKFKSYSDSYLKFKQERGGKFFGGNVDLFNNGDMLGSMQPTSVTSKMAVIGFTKPQEALKASGHQNGFSKLPQRKFFGIGKGGRMEITKLLNIHLRKALA